MAEQKRDPALNFYGRSTRETVARLIVFLGVVLAYVDPLLYAQFCKGLN